MSLLSERVQNVKPSPTLAVDAKAKAMKAAGEDIIGLAAGEPDFDTPEHIKQAAIEALNKGQTKYTAVPGIVELKDAIIDKFKRDNGLEYSRDEVIVSVGGKQALYNWCQATIDPGDEVIIPAPYWVSYPDMVALAGGTPVIVETTEEEGFLLSAEALEKAITDRTRFVVINSPSNPTGGAYTEAELQALGNVLLKHPQVWIITDDIYEKIVFDGFVFTAFPKAVPELKDRTIILNGVSKGYSMTGWRIGYCAGPAPVIKAMGIIQSQSTSNPTSIAQWGAVAAISGSQECLKPMLEAFTERCHYVVERFNTIDGLSVRMPQGAFYVYVNMDGVLNRKTPGGVTISSSMDFADYLLESEGVAVVPGVAFGMDPYFRVSFATSIDTLTEALNRIEKGIAKLEK
ncbi:MAG: pyridoxal phosphate-dependent aminotransferase [Magnetococcales bacterium]|nr:pyridoxal phosphate-dependent aminotransferase [Magnetococcales bacterium]